MPLEKGDNDPVRGLETVHEPAGGPAGYSPPGLRGAAVMGGSSPSVVQDIQVPNTIPPVSLINQRRNTSKIVSYQDGWANVSVQCIRG